ncbi:MAG: glutamyl-tRNA reductase [Prochlorococcaceae cyanobacterium MAG_34]|jgi:glutamyl-tRNA reductase|uniref:glutamyl-tRNA reductase n=1 Tax=Cyanobium usitatum TaxID=2304190 RepID=UPI0027759B8E|nr:glutamyl-tRNA reductase [Cyanobium usitatum]MDP4682106.1 glutamyl-tRNA reductase [Cyanobium sp. MAG_255]MDP4708011.1 glutamyl-tRNA reductase [Cyanobium sp. MAG_237]MDP4736867.1 glutamyl-tRNA reductase [Cyanobium sp. MAG_216]MDP4807935.1 glutamyl-tRNA reductase [Cyanobium sp. MAG_160]MDP4881812.1 glutamyl-tRNA reductase [Cyanobium sp. MAG_137]MDP4947623.1 glutamyl-tRNA reductase [Cyanobium sp. MAG_102]MDP5119457.1 glutamyl-tRNA reductase [Prochlorococcaceae cyanobacterium MAG_34]
MHIAVVGLSHRTAPVEIRERLSIPEQTMEASLQQLRADDQVLEASILSTCNRLEIYTLLRHPEQGISAVGAFLSQLSGLAVEELTPHLFTFHHEEAISHLLRVSAGLDSLVLGEGQILSQVKKMVRLGQEHHSVGPILNRLLTQAVSTGKRVRTETNLGTGAVSISSAAVELAQLKVGQARGLDELVTLDQEQVAVVGAGRMARLLLQHLQAKGCKGLVLLNRTVSKAELLAADFPALPVQCRPLDDLDHCLSTCSLVFTSTAADTPIITAERLGGLNRRSSLMLVDIGVPRNISADTAGLPGVQSYDVDDLQEVVNRNQEARREMAAEAEGLLQEESRAFLEWWDGLEAVPVVNRLRRQLEDIREQELQKALSRMGPDLSARERKVVEALSKGIINKILHTPVTNLRAPQPRQQRHSAMRVLEDLFELQERPPEP